MKKIYTTVCLMLISLLSLAQTSFSIRPDGAILKNGTPFFPMGFYIDRSTSTNDYKNQINSMAANSSYNIVNVPFNGDFTNWQSFLDLCATKGIYVVSQLYYDGDYLDQVRTYKNHSAMYGWSVADDADNGHFTTTELYNRHAACKAEDPGHVTETSLTGYYQYRRDQADDYTGIADVSGFQCYPITPLWDYDVTASNALTEGYLRTRMYVESAANHHTPMILNTQTFSWVDNDPGNPQNYRFPTVAELRNMTYSGLAAGVKGIISYAYNDLATQPSLLAEFNKLRADVSVLQDALLNGARGVVDTGDNELVATYWVHNNYCYVIAANTSYSQNKSVSIALPKNYTGAKTKIHSRLPNRLNKSGQNLVGTLYPTEVVAYKIALKPNTSDQTAYFRIRSRYDQDVVIYDDGEKARYAELDNSNIAAHWSQETVGSHVRFKNRLTGEYLNVEYNLDHVESTHVPTNYWSTHWALSDLGNGFVSIGSRALSGSLVHYDNLVGIVEHKNPNAGWWTSHWSIESVSDTEAPTKVTGLAVSDMTKTSFKVSWSAAADNVGVTSYEVFRNGTSVGTVTGLSKVLSGLSCDQTYQITVKAGDAAGNWSAVSNSKSASTATCQDYVRIKNHWDTSFYLYDGGDQASYGAVPESQLSSQWIQEDVGGGYYAFKNRATGDYLNTENGKDYVECNDAAPSNWWSSQWQLVSQGSGYFHLNNRSPYSNVLHIDSLKGYPQHLGYQTGWWTSEWQIETVGATNARVLATTVEKANASINVYPNPLDRQAELNVVADASSAVNVVLMDVQGKVYHQSSFVGSAKINLAQLSLNPGVYMVSMIQQNETTIRKIIIK